MSEMPGTFLIETQRVIPAATLDHLAAQLERWQAEPGKPLILEEGMRLRHIAPDGTISPADPSPAPTVIVRFPWWALGVGFAFGAAVASLAQAVLG